jgi:alpha-amylase/alpha-mannosidase (GH57 family)
MRRFVCIHGHFYQPPREHPWLETVEQQDGAYPFHDWNERITAECYAPNMHARVLNDEGRITRLINTYGYLSYNVGPTLLAWLVRAAPATYEGILEADRVSAQRFGGHGSAMAQAHSHAILPLARDRDRRTEVRWGLIDFRHRFGREPEGMWLPETAVDTATLETLADNGIRFTVLAPHQAARTRRVGEQRWQSLPAQGVDTTRPYLVRLPSGNEIAVFFYDGGIAQGVAFEHLLEASEAFEQRLLAGFTAGPGPQLVHVATDGESYGHHHRHGEMALAALLDRLEGRDDVSLTNYAQYLAEHPPTHEVEIVERSSWSCAHGVERWRSDCGCGSEGGTHQRWRAPLRAALDAVRDRLDATFEEHAAGLLHEPWQARDDYLEVVLDRRGHLPDFLQRHAVGSVDGPETTTILRLLELQRHALLMYTSCGWFFEDLARIEPVQVLRYAARAIQLAQGFPGNDDLEELLLERLAVAPTNTPAVPDGREVYLTRARPLVTELEQVVAHVVISELMAERSGPAYVGAFGVVERRLRQRRAGRAALTHGRLTVRSEVTLEQFEAEVAAVHLGDHNVVCGVRPRETGPAAGEAVEDGAAFVARLEHAFETAEFPELMYAIEERFGDHRYTLRSLFRDEQRQALDRVLAGVVDELEGTFRAIYRGRAPLLRFLTDVGAPAPQALHTPATVVLNADLRDQLADTDADPELVGSLLDDARRLGVELDEPGLAHTFSATVRGLAERTLSQLDVARPRSLAFESAHARVLSNAMRLLEVAEQLPFEVDLVHAQDAVWRALRDHHGELVRRAAAGDEDAARWRQELELVAAAVGVAVPE